MQPLLVFTLTLLLALAVENAGASPQVATSHLSGESPIQQSEDSQAEQYGDHERLRRSILTPLGKRITSSLVAELGKRPRELYSFGIGKRSISAKEMAEFLADEANKEHKEGSESKQHEVYDDENIDDEMAGHPDEGIYDLDMNKRSGAYSFGMGKRADAQYGFGLGRKRDPYAFGLGKRDPYSFGLGKRDPYSFGLGKRDPYAFGLGKRSPYSFGLGKRSPYSFGLGKRDPYSFGLGKRSIN